MHQQVNDGGPAFPLVADESGQFPAQLGMSLRDYFAAKAPPPPDWWDKYRKDHQSLSQEAAHTAMWNYEYADAMLKARVAALSSTSHGQGSASDGGQR